MYNLSAIVHQMPWNIAWYVASTQIFFLKWPLVSLRVLSLRMELQVTLLESLQQEYCSFLWLSLAL